MADFGRAEGRLYLDGEFRDAKSGAVYDILCRPEARATFNTLASANEISGTSNGWKGRLRIHSSSRFTTADQFWFCYLGALVGLLLGVSGGIAAWRQAGYPTVSGKWTPPGGTK